MGTLGVQVQSLTLGTLTLRTGFWAPPPASHQTDVPCPGEEMEPDAFPSHRPATPIRGGEVTPKGIATSVWNLAPGMGTRLEF